MANKGRILRQGDVSLYRQETKCGETNLVSSVTVTLLSRMDVLDSRHPRRGSFTA